MVLTVLTVPPVCRANPVPLGVMVLTVLTVPPVCRASPVPLGVMVLTVLTGPPVCRARLARLGYPEQQAGYGILWSVQLTTLGIRSAGLPKWAYLLPWRIPERAIA
jgi:hypothetical protein